MRSSIKVFRTFCGKISRFKPEISVTAHHNSFFLTPAATVAKLAAVLLFICSLFLSGAAFAQKWQDLAPDEQKVLAPLQSDWQSLSDVRKRKWREIAIKYPKMTPDQQKNLQDRMAGWAKLSPDERRKAREHYNELKQLPPEKRAAVPQKWDEYRNLPPEKREELRKKAADTKPLTPGQTGNAGAPTAKPAPPATLTPPPSAPAVEAKKP
jgi:hypothetical protein